MTWAEIARARIEAVAATIPDTATLKARKALIDAAYPFGERAYWPYRAWCKARRKYLERYGLPPLRQARDQLALFPRDPKTGRPLIP